MSSQIDVSYRPAFPRGLTILLGIAAALVVALGMKQFANILGPVFLALVLSIAVHPVRRLAARYHLPAWLGMILSLIAVYAIVFGLFTILVIPASSSRPCCRAMAHNSRPSCSRPVKPSSQSVSAKRSSKTL
jgi:predicted PurR-regulated permease PerM